MAEVEQGQGTEVVESKGAWRFATRLKLRHASGKIEIRHSRWHRKQLPALPQWAAGTRQLLASLWMPRQLNWWIGLVFALGAALFTLGSVLFLFPAVANAWGLSESQANAVFFLGSIPFTSAAYLQLFQAANARPMLGTKQHGIRWIGWKPTDAGWLSCALQFLGTLLFNVNTFDAMIPGINWWQQDLLIWVPNILGSILFLASGYLAWVEICHAHWAWQPGHISWWVGGINLLGCIAFMLSALFAFVPPHTFMVEAVTLSLTFTLLGAVAFFMGAVLLLPETAAAEITAQ